MLSTSHLPTIREFFCVGCEEPTESSVTQCIDLYQEYLDKSTSSLTTRTDASTTLISLKKKLSKVYDSISVAWLETHDSAVLATKNDNSSTYSLEFVYLDSWKSPVATDHGHGRINAEISKSWSTFYLGQVPSDDDFSEKFSNATHIDNKVYKDTSALLSNIWKKLSDTFGLPLPAKELDGLITCRMPNKKSASWSLVKAVINIMIDQHLPGDASHLRGECLFERLEADFYVWVLENISVASPVTTQMIDLLMSAHGTTSQKCATLAEKNFDINDGA